MKKMLSLLAIIGTSVPTIIAAISYPKEKKLNINKINNGWVKINWTTIM